MNSISLFDLPVGKTGIVTALTCRSAIRRRLLDMGLTVGTQVVCVGKSPAGNPKAYLICGAVIAIRRDDALTITLSVEELSYENC